MRWNKVLLAGLIGLMLVLACRFSSPTPVAWRGTPSAEAQQAVATQQSQPSSPTTAIVLPSPSPSNPIQKAPEDGPWFIFPDAQGTALYAVDLDTDTLTKLPLPPFVLVDDLTGGRAPNRSKLLVRAGGIEVPDELGLYQIESPHVKPLLVSPLLSEDLQVTLNTKQDPQAMFALQAVKQPTGISWEPQSSQALFTAALHGKASNIYLYTPADGSVDRLTVRFQQAFSPRFSPSGQRFLFQEADTLNNPKIWDPSMVASLSLANPDRVVYLYEPPVDSLAEVFVGWMNESLLLAYTETETGRQGLKLININGGSPIMLFEGSFSQVAYDPLAGRIAILVDPGSAQANQMSPGLYLSVNNASSFQAVSIGEFDRLDFSFGNGYFSAANEFGVNLFGPTEAYLALEAESAAIFSPDGNWLAAWNGQEASLYSADGSRLQTLLGEPVLELIWQEDSSGLFIVSETGLYHLTFPLLQPVLITEDVLLKEEMPHAFLGRR